MGKWHSYANRTGLWIGDLLNKHMRETLKVGVHTLVENTHMDSGRAASHWVVIPNRGNVSPGSWKQMKFNPAYNRPPVGAPGDNGKGRNEVIQAVVKREWNRSIDKVVRGSRGKQATAFEFHSSVPPYFDDSAGEESGPEESGWHREEPPFGMAMKNSYWENAKLLEAKEAALARMAQKFNALMAAGNARKNPLR